MKLRANIAHSKRTKSEEDKGSFDNRSLMFLDDRVAASSPVVVIKTLFFPHCLAKRSPVGGMIIMGFLGLFVGELLLSLTPFHTRRNAGYRPGVVDDSKHQTKAFHISN